MRARLPFVTIFGNIQVYLFEVVDEEPNKQTSNKAFIFGSMRPRASAIIDEHTDKKY